jgi:hypothetical protein
MYEQSKPELVKEVLGKLIQEIHGPLYGNLYYYPSGYGSAWDGEDTTGGVVTNRFPKYPTDQVCQVEVEESVRPGYIIKRARLIDTSNPDDGFFGEWYQH